MIFYAPHFFWALLSIPLLGLLLLWSRHRRKKLLEQFAAPQLLSRLVPSSRGWATAIRELLLLSALFFLVIALARPQWGRLTQNVQRQGLDLMLVADVSLSMKARDIAPDRITRLRHEIGDFLEQAQGDRIGLVGFAAEAKLLCPLTIDYGALHLFVDELEPSEFLQGTDIASALERAEAALPQHESSYQIIILMSDGEEHDPRALEVAKRLAEKGITLYTIGIGSTSGVPIPLDGPGGLLYKKDRRGEIVTTRLNEELMRQIAQAGRGSYFHTGPDDFELRRVLEEIRDRERREIDSNLYEQMAERYQIPLAIALILLSLEMLSPSELRRRKRSSP
jgi:Ca-activated chloride channel family protein